MNFFIRKSVANQMKNNAELESLKAEVISILKNKDREDVKKANEFFSRNESILTHVEKSIDGSYIEKAGYGVGTIRIWRGKKYKKVSASPTKWVRVYNKEDRGAKSSMTRLINRAEACKSIEELYQFCMSNKALFQDENGVELPIMDKLRAKIDDKKARLENGEKTAKPAKEETKPEVKEEEKQAEENIDIESKKKREEENKKFSESELDKFYKGEVQEVKRLNKQLEIAKKAKNDASIKEYSDLLKLHEMYRDEYKKARDEKRKESENKPAEQPKEDVKETEKPSLVENKVLGKTESGVDIVATNNTDDTKKVAIATAKMDGNKAVIPYSKDLEKQLKTMEKMFSKEDNRPFLEGFGYSDGYLCATDGHQLIRLKIDGIDGNAILNKKGAICVKITRQGENYTLEADDRKIGTSLRSDQAYPAFERVIPQNNTKSININNEAITTKFKEMNDAGIFDGKIKRVIFDFNDGNVMLDGVKVGNVDKDIEAKTMSFDYSQFNNLLNKKADTTINFNGGALNAVSVSTNIGDKILMPTVSENSESYYRDMRENGKIRKETLEKTRTLRKESNDGFVESLKQATKEHLEKEGWIEKQLENVKGWTDEQILKLWNCKNVDMEKLSNTKDFVTDSFMRYTNKEYGFTPRNVFQNYYALQDEKLSNGIEAELKRRGLSTSIQKSIFDDFDFEPAEENACCDSYDASQPDLFNSPAVKVSIALRKYFSEVC